MRRLPASRPSARSPPWAARERVVAVVWQWRCQREDWIRSGPAFQAGWAGPPFCWNGGEAASIIGLERTRFVVCALWASSRRPACLLAAAASPAPQLAPVTPYLEDSLGVDHSMRFAGWYLKIAAVGASIGAAMELFMIHTGFCTLLAPLTPPLPSIQPFPLVVSLKLLIQYQTIGNELSTVQPQSPVLAVGSFSAD